MNKLKQILKHIIRIKIVMIALVIILVLTVFLPAFTYFITIDDGTYDEDDWESTPYVASTYTDQVNVSGNGLEPVKSANELWDEMTFKGNNIRDYLDKPEELERLMNAEIITQYPKIGNGNLDGIIEFERHKTDGTSRMLKFVDYNTFNSYINSQNSDILNYFTLNENKEVLIAVINKNTEELTTNDADVVISEYTSVLTDSDKKSDNTYKKEEYIITTQKINYRNYVEKYTMPFQYLWALLVISEDKDFVLDLANLVENSKIVISIYDNIKTTVDQNTYTYKKEQRTDTYVRVSAENNYGVEDYPKERYWLSEQSPEASEHYDSNYQADYDIEEVQYKVIHTITDETNTTIVDISEADTWIAEYSRKYNYQSAQNESEEKNTVTLENTDYSENSNSPESSDENKELLKDSHALELAEEAKKYIEQNAEQEEDDRDNNPLNITTPSDPFNVALPNGSSNASENQSIIDSIIGAGSAGGIIRPNKGNTNNQVNNNETVDNNVKDNNKKPVEAKVNVQYVQKRYYKHDIDRTQENVKTTSYQKYIPQPAQEDMKDEKGNGQVNFVTILCSKEHKSAKSNILEVDEWLFEILEINNDTKNMVDLTKYLLQKALERNYGVSDFDFSLYRNSDFTNVSSFYTNILFDYLCSWENLTVLQYLKGKIEFSDYVGQYITEDRTQFICYKDKDNTRNFGFGVCHTADYGQTYWHVSEYANEGIDITSGEYDTVGVSKLDVDIVNRVKEKLINNFEGQVKSVLQSEGILGELTQQQIHALTCIAYQYGNIGNFAEMYKRYGNTENLRNAVTSTSGTKYFLDGIENNGRANANWTLFHDGKYISGSGEQLIEENYLTEGNILSIATKVWKQVVSSGRFTTYGGAKDGIIPCIGSTIDCSAYVSWVLYEYGYPEEFYYQHGSDSFYTTNWKQKYGWEEIYVDSRENPISKLQPGDIFVRYGEGTHHMNLIVSIEGTKVYAYDCGNADNWLNNSTGGPVDATWFLTYPGSGKIIRVKNNQ